jgi:hypothetical protein
MVVLLLGYVERRLYHTVIRSPTLELSLEYPDESLPLGIDTIYNRGYRGNRPLTEE